MKWYHYLIIAVIGFYIIKNFKLPIINLPPFDEVKPPFNTDPDDWDNGHYTGDDCPWLPQNIKDFNISRGNDPCDITFARI